MSKWRSVQIVLVDSCLFFLRSFFLPAWASAEKRRPMLNTALATRLLGSCQRIPAEMEVFTRFLHPDSKRCRNQILSNTSWIISKHHQSHIDPKKKGSTETFGNTSFWSMDRYIKFWEGFLKPKNLLLNVVVCKSTLQNSPGWLGFPAPSQRRVALDLAPLGHPKVRWSQMPEAKCREVPCEKLLRKWVFSKIEGKPPIFEWMIWGYHYFWKHPNEKVTRKMKRMKT